MFNARETVLIEIRVIAFKVEARGIALIEFRVIAFKVEARNRSLIRLWFRVGVPDMSMKNGLSSVSVQAAYRAGELHLLFILLVLLLRLCRTRKRTV
jgi:hypothetical protein